MKSPIFSARLSLFLLTRRRRQGFSMLEVLVALFAAFFFLMGTMNAMVVAAVMQVKAERQAQALYWIQQDLEAVRAEANSLEAFYNNAVEQTTPPQPLTTASKTSLQNYYANVNEADLFIEGFARMLRDKIDDSETKTDPSANSPTLIQDLIKFSNNADKNKFTINSLNATSPSSVNVQVQVAQRSDFELVGKTYRLIRVIQADDANPDVLKLSYYVGVPDDAQTTYNPTNNPPQIPYLKTSASDLISTLYTEILPSAAL